MMVTLTSSRWRLGGDDTPSQCNVAAAPAVESSVFREHSYCVLLANLFCHAGKAFVPAKKFVKIGAGGGGAHGVWLRRLLPHRLMPWQPCDPNLVLRCVPGSRQQIEPPTQALLMGCFVQQKLPQPGVGSKGKRCDGGQIAQPATGGGVGGGGSRGGKQKWLPSTMFSTGGL